MGKGAKKKQAFMKTNELRRIGEVDLRDLVEKFPNRRSMSRIEIVLSGFEPSEKSLDGMGSSRHGGEIV